MGKSLSNNYFYQAIHSNQYSDYKYRPQCYIPNHMNEFNNNQMYVLQETFLPLTFLSRIHLQIGIWRLQPSFSLLLFFLLFYLHAEKSFRNLIKSNRNRIVFTIIRLIWNQTNLSLVLNQSEILRTIYLYVEPSGIPFGSEVKQKLSLNSSIP